MRGLWLVAGDCIERIIQNYERKGMPPIYSPRLCFPLPFTGSLPSEGKRGGDLFLARCFEDVELALVVLNIHSTPLDR